MSRTLTSSLLALALVATQAAAIQLAPSPLVVRIVLPATIALVPVALWRLRGHLGVWVMFVGLAANLAAILANGGLMPIERATVVEAVGEERAAGYEPGAWIRHSKDVLVAPGEGRLVALGDSIILRVGDRGLAASPGDLVVAAGLLLLATEASVRWQRQRARVPGKDENQRSSPRNRPAKAERGATTTR